VKSSICYLLLILTLIHIGCSAPSRKLEEPVTMDQYLENKDRYKQEKAEEEAAKSANLAITKVFLWPILLPVCVSGLAVVGVYYVTENAIEDVKWAMRSQ
jgi:hypothetical protein